MTRWTAALLLLGGCVEPPKTMQMEALVSGFRHIHEWHPAMQARGDAAYDGAVSRGEEMWPVLAVHIEDETPTALFEPTHGINPPVGDLCFLLLLKMTGLEWKEFYPDVFIQTVLPNPVFNVRWAGPGSRANVRRKFLAILKMAEDGTP